jgi:hypothetical protein
MPGLGMILMHFICMPLPPHPLCWSGIFMLYVVRLADLCCAQQKLPAAHNAYNIVRMLFLALARMNTQR